nr:hypothetical protein [Tanacetum cinerariifolium]
MSNTNNNMQTQTLNTLHNAIMEASSKDRLPMLAPGNYVQWKSRIKRYIDTKPKHELIHHCLKNPPYKLAWAEKQVLKSEGSPEPRTERYMETYKNLLQDIRDQLNAEAEAVQIILTGIDNDIYSTVDACPNACEMWKIIERLKQGESINVQDLKTNLFWEFGKFMSHDGESLESYYSRFYKMMNELIRNQCNSQELKTVSYHKLYDILKQHQNEVNEIKAERIAHNANPLALVAQQQPVYNPQNHPTHYNQNSLTRSQQTATKNRGKAIVNSPTPIYDQEPSMVAEDDEMSKDKEIDKLMALISLSFKKIYKPTNNNLRTSSNTSRANQDNSLRINRGTGYDNQRLGNVAWARETVGTMVVQKSRIQCYNYKEFGHVARECQKPKRAKDAAYHREKMLLSHCMYMAKLQKVTPDVADNSGPIFDTEPMQQEMVADLRYFNSLELEVDSLRSQLETQKTQFLNEIDRLFEGILLLEKGRVEDHRRNVKFSKNKTSVTACNDSLNAKNLNVNFVCATCGNVNLNVSMPLGNASRAANVLDPQTSRGSNVSNTSLSSNSFAARRDYPIHRQLWKPSVKFFYIFVTLSYIVRDGENLDKMKEKGDACIFVGYSTQSRAYRVFNKRTRVIVETIHVNFDELPQMVSDHVSSDPAPKCQTMALEHDSLSLSPKCQENVPHTDKTVTMLNELDLLFSLMFEELLNGSSQVVLKSSAATATDAPHQRQQLQTTPLNTQTTTATTCQDPSQASIVTSTENMNQTEMNAENAQ